MLNINLIICALIVCAFAATTTIATTVIITRAKKVAPTATPKNTRKPKAKSAAPKSGDAWLKAHPTCTAAEAREHFPHITKAQLREKKIELGIYTGRKGAAPKTETPAPAPAPAQTKPSGITFDKDAFVEGLCRKIDIRCAEMYGNVLPNEALKAVKQELMGMEDLMLKLDADKIVSMMVDGMKPVCQKELRNRSISWMMEHYGCSEAVAQKCADRFSVGEDGLEKEDETYLKRLMSLEKARAARAAKK